MNCLFLQANSIHVHVYIQVSYGYINTTYPSSHLFNSSSNHIYIREKCVQIRTFVFQRQSEISPLHCKFNSIFWKREKNIKSDSALIYNKTLLYSKLQIITKSAINKMVKLTFYLDMKMSIQLATNLTVIAQVDETIGNITEIWFLHHMLLLLSRNLRDN